jgi:probable HAF family extracellular repeat protein
MEGMMKSLRLAAAVFGTTLLAASPATSAQQYIVTKLGNLGGVYCYGLAIGQVTGYADLPSGYDRAFLYSDGTMRDLGILPGGGDSFGAAINDRGARCAGGHAGTEQLPRLVIRTRDWLDRIDGDAE